MSARPVQSRGPKNIELNTGPWRTVPNTNESPNPKREKHCSPRYLRFLMPTMAVGTSIGWRKRYHTMNATDKSLPPLAVTAPSRSPICWHRRTEKSKTNPMMPSYSVSSVWFFNLQESTGQQCGSVLGYRPRLSRGENELLKSHRTGIKTHQKLEVTAACDQAKHCGQQQERAVNMNAAS